MGEKYYVTKQETILDLLHRFTDHPPKEDQPERYEEIRSFAHVFAGELLKRCPESRELSLAITNLEQTVFWANAAIARNECKRDHLEDCDKEDCNDEQCEDKKE